METVHTTRLGLRIFWQGLVALQGAWQQRGGGADCVDAWTLRLHLGLACIAVLQPVREQIHLTRPGHNVIGLQLQTSNCDSLAKRHVTGASKQTAPKRPVLLVWISFGVDQSETATDYTSYNSASAPLLHTAKPKVHQVSH